MREERYYNGLIAYWLISLVAKLQRIVVKAAARHPKGWRLLPKGRKKAER